MLDSRTKDEVYQQAGTTGVSNYSKRCAKEAALAVAQNWNPGLTLGQQKEGVYKVADAVYNANPCFTKSVIGKAIPGLDVKTKYKVKNNSSFGPMAVSYSTTSHSDIMAQKTVNYSNETKYLCRWYDGTSSNYGNHYYVMWLGIDKGSNPANRRSMFDEIDQTKAKNAEYVLQQHEIYGESHICHRDSYASTDYDYADRCHYFYFNTLSTSTSYSGLSGYSFYTNLNSYKVNSSYTLQTDSLNSTLSTTTYSKRSTGSDANYVQVSIASDSTNGGKIKVQTDSDIGYAVPASCNVDIVLAVPVNSAACNENGRDLASDTAENPLSYTGSTLPSTVKNTPIYQMGQALKNFVKDNFFHTRGVYMSLIPYSGKLSISPDRALDWTVSIPQFDDSSINTQVMIGACLYGTQGQKDAKLKRDNIITTIKTGTTISAPYYWGGLQQGCPIMCRQGTCSQYSRYGNNYAASGILLNTSNPGDSNNYRYRRMNLNPCYMGYANTLGMKCEKTCRYYSANPFYIIEPTTDLVKIYEMCNALIPVYDTQNVSNFVFLPLEWANNFFQSWTRNEAVSTAVTGTSTTATLTSPSKTTEGRKKAIILLVNKPDWFEPGELTYLGFDNDYSEIPMAESDKIVGNINYSDTAKKYLDGTTYDGTLYGPKKILEVTGFTRNSSTGYYECEFGTATLKFPHKGTLKVVVEATGEGTGNLSNWTRIDDGSLSSLASTWHGGVCYMNSKFYAINSLGYVATSTNGQSWTRIDDGSLRSKRSSEWDGGIAYGNGLFATVHWETGYIMTSTNGISWIEQGNQLAGNSCNIYYNQMCYGNNKFIAVYGSGSNVIISSNGTSWTKESTNLSSIYSGSWYGGTCYANGKFIAINEKGYVASSTDGITWTSHGSPLSAIASSEWYGGTCYGHGKFIAINGKGYVAATTSGSTLQFSGILSKSDGTTTSEYAISGKQEFYIDSSQITGGSEGAYQITMTCNGIRLISAEITNREYQQFTPTCYLTGTTNTLGTTGTAYIKTSYPAKMYIRAKSYPKSSITFYSTNGVTENVGTHYLTSTTTFTFNGYSSVSSSSYSPGPNFGSNYTINKINYSGSYISLTASIPSGYQLLRYSSSGMDTGIVMSNRGSSITSYTSNKGDSWTMLCMNIRSGYFYWYTSPTGSNTSYVYTAYVTSSDRSVSTDAYGNSLRIDSCSTLSSYHCSSRDSYYSSFYCSGSGASGSSLVMYIRDLPDYCYLYRFFVRNEYSIGWLGMNYSDSYIENNQGVTATSSWIKFQGDSRVNVTVTPTGSGTGYIRYTTASGSSSSHTISTSSYTTITIDPTVHRFERSSDGSIYTVTLSLDNIQLDGTVSFVDTTPTKTYRLKDLANGRINTRTISYFGSSPSYNSSLLGWGNNTWYNPLTYYRSISYKYGYTYSYMYPSMCSGDISHLMGGDDGIVSAYAALYSGNDYTGGRYYVPGSTRLFSPMWRQSTSYRYCQCCEYSGYYDSTTSGGSISLYASDATWPMNLVLNRNGYQPNTDTLPSAAVSAVTSAACAKLKTDYGANLRIYVIKYRKQEKYKSFPLYNTTQTDIVHDYTTVDACATTSNLYTIDNEEDLKTKLNEIAADIKSWAGYTKAKNVE